MTPIASIFPVSQVAGAYRGDAVGTSGTGDFESLASDAARSAIRNLRHAEQATAAGVAGKTDVQSVVEALSSAQLTMQSVIAVRDKVLGAYNDIMHMSV
jgi:flagellar hook-basal body complex protein FliE